MLRALIVAGSALGLELGPALLPGWAPATAVVQPRPAHQVGHTPRLPRLRLPAGSVEHPLPASVRLAGIPLALRIFTMRMDLEAAADALLEQIEEPVRVLAHGGGLLLMPQAGPQDWLLALSSGRQGTDAVLSRFGAMQQAGGAAGHVAPAWLPAGSRTRFSMSTDEAGIRASDEIHINPGYGPEAMLREAARGLVRDGWARVADAAPVSHWRLGGSERVLVGVAMPSGSAVLVHTIERLQTEGGLR